MLRVETSGVHKGNRASVYPAGVACKRLCGDVPPAGFLQEEINHVCVAVEEPPAEELIRIPLRYAKLVDHKSSLQYNVMMRSIDVLHVLLRCALQPRGVYVFVTQPHDVGHASLYHR